MNPYAAYYGGADPYAAYGGYPAYMQYGEYNFFWWIKEKADMPDYDQFKRITANNSSLNHLGPTRINR